MGWEFWALYRYRIKDNPNPKFKADPVSGTNKIKDKDFRIDSNRELKLASILSTLLLLDFYQSALAWQAELLTACSLQK